MSDYVATSQKFENPDEDVHLRKAAQRFRQVMRGQQGESLFRMTDDDVLEITRVLRAYYLQRITTS